MFSDIHYENSPDPESEAIVINKETADVLFKKLTDFSGFDDIKQIFFEELNYERVNTPLSTRTWGNIAKGALADNPILFAKGGEDGGFHIIYLKLNSEKLLLGLERPVINALLKDNHDYALYLFSDINQDRWHFVNVKYDKKAKSRRVFRRITVGPEERIRTATERLAMLDLNVLSEDLFDIPPSKIQEQHDLAFDVEAVTDDFFKQFADLYHLVREDIASFNPHIEKSGELAQQLMDRLLFLYFIQKKGWLNQEHDYLISRFESGYIKSPDESTYYSEVLAPLFISLSNDNGFDQNVGTVPFLNGGLFEDIVFEDSRLNDSVNHLQVKNSTFNSIFTNLLERFNFTVTEDTPLDSEVAIDPEMLGKIYESLILQLEKDPEKDRRKLTGSYYTPRAIVHFMCQESLKEYMCSSLCGEENSDNDVIRENLGTLFELPLAAHLDDEQQDELNNLFSLKQAKELKNALLVCRICDPAVGSGAFPVGMLYEMISTLAKLDFILHGRETILAYNYDYDLKKRIVERCLYGVDIQEQSVRLCELRLWLSLVVDYETNRELNFSKAMDQVPSLPNLSYRFMQGDSLLERLFGHVVQLDSLAKDDKTKQLIDSIQSDKNSYFHEGNALEKRHLELKIISKQVDLADRLIDEKKRVIDADSGFQDNIFGVDNLSKKEQKEWEAYQNEIQEIASLKHKVSIAREEITDLKKDRKKLQFENLRKRIFKTGEHPTFIWKVDFSEVFLEKDGFDIMIANPPYVSADKGELNLEKRKSILICGFYETLWEKWDLYVPFIERGFKYLCKNGILQFITSDAYSHAKYAQKSQEWFLNNSSILRIDFISDLKIFNAGVHNIIFAFQRRNNNANIPNRILHKKYFGDIEILPSESQKNATFRIFQKDSYKKTKEIKTDSFPLGDILYISVGAVCNSHEKKSKVKFSIKDLISKTEDKKHPIKFIEGKDIEKWRIKGHKYFEWNTERSPKYLRRPTFPELYSVKPKLLAAMVSGGGIKVVYDNQALFCNHGLFVCVPWYSLRGVDNKSISKSAKYLSKSNETIRNRYSLEELSQGFALKYLLGIMNSKWSHHFLNSIRRSNIQLYPDDWKKVPIPVASKSQQDKIIKIVDVIIEKSKKKLDITEEEKNLNDIVDLLYEGKLE